MLRAANTSGGVGVAPADFNSSGFLTTLASFARIPITDLTLAFVSPASPPPASSVAVAVDAPSVVSILNALDGLTLTTLGNDLHVPLTTMPTSQPTNPPSSGGNPAGAIVGTIFGLLALAGLAAVGYHFYKKHQQEALLRSSEVTPELDYKNSAKKVNEAL